MTSTDPRLERFLATLRSDGFAGEIVSQGGHQPTQTLVVPLTDDDDQPAWQLEIAFVPGMEQQLDGLGLAQFFVAVAGGVADANLPALREAVVALNAQLPIVGFGVMAEPRTAIFRSVLMTPTDLDAASALALQTTWMVSYLLSLYGAVVADIATRGTPFADAISGHAYAQLFI